MFVLYYYVILPVSHSVHRNQSPACNSLLCSGCNGRGRTDGCDKIADLSGRVCSSVMWRYRKRNVRRALIRRHSIISALSSPQIPHTPRRAPSSYELIATSLCRTKQTTFHRRISRRLLSDVNPLGRLRCATTRTNAIQTYFGQYDYYCL